ncbi:ROK family transcriptional regulator [Fictibacillus enclensis]|uniref:ROK family transcriptional regulator n=1 Tax=Fictibacillus enclensis TaxID=1017270 RepID=UPI0025A0D585|nr:ROK family transcriptional regulator [Fictibacillus enclensis]MDM5201298.1 ROK family transcriptional regulator [Fictibacillus enclensis]
MKSNHKGGTAFMKEKNKRCVLRCVKEKGPISRSEVADQLLLSKPTVSALVEELLQENWLKEVGPGSAGLAGGRKPIQLLFNSRAAHVIGIDMGGTKVRAGICDLDGQLLAVDEFPTPTQKKSLLKALKQNVENLLNQASLNPDDILGMGIGAPGMTDTERGVVIDAPSLSWTQYPLKKEAEALFPWPVMVENDVNVAVLGEQWLGAAKGMNHVVLISIGTGVGCGMLINGQLYRGATWAAGEIGYMVTDMVKARSEDLPPPHVGYGHLEQYVGGAGIVQSMKQELKDQPESLFPNNFSAKDVFQKAKDGDRAAGKVIDEVIDHIGFAVANMISIINPEVVLLGGGISRSADWFLPRIQKTIQDFASVSAPVLPTALGENLGVVGAVSLVLRETESVLKEL